MSHFSFVQKPQCQQGPQYQAGYQQALIDFSLIDLFDCIRAGTGADPIPSTMPEVEALAATFIQILMASLNCSV
ncbi:hypothetical protein C7B76_31775, partial [filamentous cyanobacterium CCP2]